MKSIPIGLGLEGPDLPALARDVQQRFFANRLPTSLSVDMKEKKPSTAWLEEGMKQSSQSVVAYWEESGAEEFLIYHRDRLVQASFIYPLDADRILELLTELNVTVVSSRTIHREWKTRTPPYVAPSFSRLHFPHGWGCAFKGPGHDDLVSQRWLDYGPWRTVRGAGNTTLVQFHDFEVDADTALQQAKPGHQRMGITDTGGFIQKNYVYQDELKGIYNHDQRLLKIVVHGRDVSQREMLDACAARKYQALGEGQPIERIAYIFMDETEARRHLHELWLRELECWTIINGLEVRLDENYAPESDKPDWV